MINIGYCCINTTLKKSGITTNRSMIRRTFDARGIGYASELALQNVKDLQHIIEWNVDNDISVFRISSNMFPWNSEYTLSDLPDFDEIAHSLKSTGDYIKQTGIRVSFHPDHFVKLASLKPTAVENSIGDLNHHGEVFDIMGLDRSRKYPINIHIGSAGGDKVGSINRFIKTLDMLDESVKLRLVVENDDKLSLYSINDLVSTVGNYCPITFDYFHHSIHPDGLSEQDAFELAYATWPSDITPLFHYSDSKQLYEHSDARYNAHADMVYNRINNYGHRVDVDLEAKSKELAVSFYRDMVT